MASSRSLLDRLEYPQAESQRELPGNADQTLDSICRHLQVMMNTKQGGSQTVPDFGMTDFSEIARGNQSMSRVQEEIRRSIEKYEPRLADVQVNFYQVENQPFTLHFDIHAKVLSSDRKSATVFQSTIETSGEIKVNRRD
jgi:type VI secretion system protein